MDLLRRAVFSIHDIPLAYSTSYYFLSEILAGMPNVDTTSFTDSWIKFGLANAPWITMPWLVLWCGLRLLLPLKAQQWNEP